MHTPGADPRLATDVECATPRAQLASAEALAEQGCVLEEKVCMDQARCWLGPCNTCTSSWAPES